MTYVTRPIIGATYMYRGDKKGKMFVVKSYTEHGVLFKCGHWCTDNVFSDLWRLTEPYTGVIGQRAVDVVRPDKYSGAREFTSNHPMAGEILCRSNFQFCVWQ